MGVMPAIPAVLHMWDMHPTLCAPSRLFLLVQVMLQCGRTHNSALHYCHMAVASPSPQDMFASCTAARRDGFAGVPASFSM